MQRRDPSEICGLPHRGGTAGLGGLGDITVAGLGDRLPGGIRPCAFLVLVAGVILLKGVIAVFVGHLVLDKAEIDRHLVDRAGHPSALRRPWPAVRCDGHYLTKPGRPPSNAVPTRTCVAPAAMASSKSPLIPADTMTASG